MARSNLQLGITRQSSHGGPPYLIYGSTIAAISARVSHTCTRGRPPGLASFFMSKQKGGAARTAPPDWLLDRQSLQVDRLLFEDPSRLLALLLVVVEPGPRGDEL